MRRIATLSLLLALFLGGCARMAQLSDGTNPRASIPNATSQATAHPATAWWRPSGILTWQWQLSGAVDPTLPAAVYDIDGFDSDAALVTSLHSKGRHVICYISAGTWENWRPDAGQYPAAVIGKPDTGWNGEKWVDIRRIGTLAPILEHRLDMCKAKGFDAVEPDNIDGYANDTGFLLTYADQIRFNTWLAQQAHARGLSIGLKNDPDQAPDLVSTFDWALTEDCFVQGWCDQMTPFVKVGKSVFEAEYTNMRVTLAQVCGPAHALGFGAIIKNRDLGAWVASC